MSEIAISESTLVAVGSVLSAIVVILTALWRFYLSLENKINSRVSELEGKVVAQSEAHTSLAGEFRELRGEIRARFALRDESVMQEALRGVIDKAVRDTVERSGHDR